MTVCVHVLVGDWDVVEVVHVLVVDSVATFVSELLGDLLDEFDAGGLLLGVEMTLSRKTLVY